MGMLLSFAFLLKYFLNFVSNQLRIVIPENDYPRMLPFKEVIFKAIQIVHSNRINLNE